MRSKRTGKGPRKSGKSLPKKSGAQLSRLRAKAGKSSPALIERALEGKAGAKLQKQREKLQRAAAQAAKEHYRPRKKDRGKIVIISNQGKPGARKGYAVHVTKTGKVRLLKPKGVKEPLKSRKASQIQLPAYKNLHKVVRAYEVSRGHGVREKDSVSPRGVNDFNDSVVKRIAKSVRFALQNQVGQRVFIIRAMALVELPDGRKQTIEFFVDIARRDSDTIRIAGINNFVRQKFYAMMVRELSYLGYVTAGSANHIRHLGQNQGLPREEWTDKTGDLWGGIENETVKLMNIEWKIEQAT